MSNDNLVPEPQPSVFDAVNGVLQDEEAARRVMANPALAKGFPNGRPGGIFLMRGKKNDVAHSPFKIPIDLI